MITSTPLIKITYKYKGNIKEIFTKLEYYNITGSIKDRVAYYILNEAKKNNELKDNMIITEATSGNTGIALAALGTYYKHEVYIFMPNWVSEERLKLMEMYNAHVKLYSKEEGGFKKCIEEAKNYAIENNGFLANQFSNENNIKAHYETTGKEVVDSLDKIDGFISGIGTGGTLMGIGKRIKEQNSKAIIAALEPSTMAILSNGLMTGHKIEGIGDDFIPEIVNQNNIDMILRIKDSEAIEMAKSLAKNLGLGVGISSGANMLGAILLNDKIGGNIVTVFPDDNKKYLSTDLSKEYMGKSIVDEIELIKYEMC